MNTFSESYWKMFFFVLFCFPNSYPKKERHGFLDIGNPPQERGRRNPRVVVQGGPRVKTARENRALGVLQGWPQNHDRNHHPREISDVSDLAERRCGVLQRALGINE